MDTDAPREPQDMSVIANRLSLINRYNRSLGVPGPGADRLQVDFINGFMDPRKLVAFVAQCELIIESRWPMQPQSKVTLANPGQRFTIPKVT